jgi:hypothetical protein
MIGGGKAEGNLVAPGAGDPAIPGDARTAKKPRPVVRQITSRIFGTDSMLATAARSSE